MDRPKVPESFHTTPEGAVVQAHLDQLHAPVDAGLDRLVADALTADGEIEIGSARRQSGVGMRVRLGRGLVALGAAVAGEEPQQQNRGNAA